MFQEESLHAFTLMVCSCICSHIVPCNMVLSMHMYVGIPRKISFPFCACESDCIKLIRLHYWPATSSKPLVAFTFHFLDWLEALLLECQVAVQDMTQAISFLIRDKIGKVIHRLPHDKHRNCA